MVTTSPVSATASAEGDTGEYVIKSNDAHFNSSQHYPSNYIRTAKYTLVTFLPLNLFEQFRRFSNVYFLLNAIVALSSPTAPVNPFTSIAPLVFVLGVTAIKDAIEDHRRYVADKKANSSPFQVLRDGRLVNLISSDIKAGDIVYVKKKQMFPADLVVLWTSNDEGLCYIETANLDGETNLKRRVAPQATWELTDPERSLTDLRATVTCELPNVRLYHFEGRLDVESPSSSVTALTANNLLQRGAELRNTEHIFGIVVYAGTDTKLFKNLDTTVSKVGHLETRLNRTVMGLFCLKLVLLLVCAVSSGLWHKDTGKGLAYIDWPDSAAEVGLLHMLSYFVLYTYVIPISLFVTVEIVRVLQAVFMLWDDQMPGNRPRNSNANENLGLVQHVFSDKTGTLTRNVMRLVRLFIDGAAFDEEVDPGCTLRKSRGSQLVARKVDTFLRYMAICNTAVPDLEDTPGEVVYQADSPDEVALLQAAQANGFELYSRRTDTAIVHEEGTPREYRILATLEFTPDRKRMSIVYEDPETGDPVLVCKGADSYIMERSRDRDPLRDQIQGAVDAYASEGLRTLLYAVRVLGADEYRDWKAEFDEANASIVERAKKVHDVCERLEVNMELLGCTAVEDRLQENVPATLKYLFRAGIQLWLLTGDKQETAINIGKSSQLLLPEFELALINATTSHDVSARISEHTEHYERHEGTAFAVVIDGKSLEFALDHFPLRFITLGAKAKSVIVCRATPLQKARVVKLAKEQLGVTALAIGDGSNDVAMIQEAEVGVGIMGREGSQAARASDYAIAEFQDLRRLVCVHGRYSYLRLSGLIQYSFYKNLAYILPQFYFAFMSGFSAQVFYDEWMLAFFNMFFTSLPPLIYGINEKDVPESVIDKYPEVYRYIQRAPLYTVRTFLGWVATAVYHSLVIFFFNYASGISGTGPVTSDGMVGGIWSQAILASHLGVTVVTLKMALYIKSWTWMTHLSIWLSLVGYFFWLVIYSYWFALQPNMYLVFFKVITSGRIWAIYLVAVVAALMFDFAAEYLARQYAPKDWMILQEWSRFLRGKPGIPESGGIGHHDDEVLVADRTKNEGELMVFNGHESGNSNNNNNSSNNNNSNRNNNNNNNNNNNGNDYNRNGNGNKRAANESSNHYGSNNRSKSDKYRVEEQYDDYNSPYNYNSKGKRGTISEEYL